MKRTKPRRHRGPVAARVAEPGPAASREPVPARDRRTWLVAIPLVLLVATAFFPAVDNPFVAWDDDLNFLGNADYRGLGWPQVRWACTNFKAGVYQPMAWLAFEAQYVLFGLDPRGYHLTSLLLHAAVAVVLLRPGRRPARPLPARPLPRVSLGARRRGRAGRGPVRRAPAAGRGGRLGLVPALSPLRLFCLLAVLAYLHAFGPGPPRWGWWAGSLLLFAAALLSKAPAVALPAILVLLDVYPLRRLGGRPGGWFGPEAPGLAG